MYALLKSPPFKATGDQRWINGTKHMGIYRTSELVEESLSKMRWKKGVNGNGTSMYVFFLVCFSVIWVGQESKDMETFHNTHFRPTSSQAGNYKNMLCWDLNTLKVLKETCSFIEICLQFQISWFSMVHVSFKKKKAFCFFCFLSFFFFLNLGKT